MVEATNEVIKTKFASYVSSENHTVLAKRMQGGTRSPYVMLPVELEKQQGTVFVDSGCSFNAISIEFAKRCQIPYLHYPDNPILCEVGGKKTVKIERRVAEGTFAMEGIGTYTTCVYVMDVIPMDADAIFGMDFLMDVNPKIDWKKGTATGRAGVSKPSDAVYGNARGHIQEEQKVIEKLHFHRFVEHESEKHGKTKVITMEEYLQEVKEATDETLFFMVNPVDKETEKAKRFKKQGWEALKENPAFPILNKYKDTVFKEELDITDIKPKHGERIEHEIDVTDDTPFNLRQFRLSPEQQKAVAEWTETMVNSGLIRRSTSPFNSPLFCVKKPVGWRIVHDFRHLNARTRIPREPIPRKDEIIDSMSGSYYFSCMDLLSGYYQLLLRDSDCKFTAFSTPTGHYEYVVTAMGLAGAPSTFNRYVQSAFRGLEDKCRAFFDDVFIFTQSRAIEDHLAALDQVLQRCEQEGITIKLSKCVFLADEIPVLGEWVGRAGVRVDPDKVAVVKDWPVPRRVSDMKSFLGTIVYCAKFLKDYGRLVAPLQIAIAGAKHKNQRINLSGDQLAAFEAMKQAMIEAPVLAIADFTKPFGIRMDASDFAIGGVLFQIDSNGVEHPIAYTGRKMTSAELRYPVREKELLAIMHALRVWRPYLIDHAFRVETDHRSLETLLTQKNCTQRLARWLNTLSEYRPQFTWIPGNTNDTADGLSRRPDFMPANGARASTVDLRDLMRAILAEEDAEGAQEESQLYFQNVEQAELFCFMMSERDVATQCREGYAKDPEFAAVWKAFSEGGQVVSKDKFRYHNGLIWYVNPEEDAEWKLCIPESESLRKQVIFSEHDVVAKGHPGQFKTRRFMKRKYYWKGMDKFVVRYCKTCEKCARNKHRQTKPPGRLHPLPIPSSRWEDITMDFITDLPLSEGSNAIWVIIDRMTKRGHFIPIKMGEGESAAIECARIFCREFIRLHGLPSSIISDRDTRFKSSFWTELMKLLQISQSMSSAFKPSTDGQSERTNRFIEDYLRNYVHPRQDDWKEYLYSAEFAYNARFHEAIRMSPFEADLGYVPKMFPEHVFAKLLDARPRRVSDAYEFGRRQQEVLELAKGNLKQAQERAKKYYDRNRPVQEFEIGDMVMLSTHNLDVEHTGVIAKGSRKLAPLWIGPYKVVAKTTPDTYRIQLPLGLRLHPEFHTSFLKPYHQDVDPMRNNRPNEGMISAGGVDDSYLVEGIVGHRKVGRKVQYLVKWLGYSSDENTWEPLENLLKPVGHLLEAYVAEKRLKKSIWLK